jgi:hypothetical protein
MEKSIANLILNQLINSSEFLINSEKVPSPYYDRLELYKKNGIEFKEYLTKEIYTWQYEHNVYVDDIDYFFSGMIGKDIHEEELIQLIDDSKLPFESELDFEDFKRLKHYDSMAHLLDCYGEREVRLEFDFDFFEDEEELEEISIYELIEFWDDSLCYEEIEYLTSLGYTISESSEEEVRLNYDFDFFEDELEEIMDELCWFDQYDGEFDYYEAQWEENLRILEWEFYNEEIHLMSEADKRFYGLEFFEDELDEIQSNNNFKS